MTRNQPTWTPAPVAMCPPREYCAGADCSACLPPEPWLRDGARVVVAGIESRTYTLRAAGDGWLLCHRARRWPATTEQVLRRCRPEREGKGNA